MPCESLDGAWKIETHSRVRGGCHMSTSPDRGVTTIFKEFVGQRYTSTIVLALLQEVAQFPGVKLNWNVLVKQTSIGISDAREYQMSWLHFGILRCLA